MSGGSEEKITKRMLDRRHLTGDLGGKARHGGKGRKGGKGKGGSKPSKGPAPTKTGCTPRPTTTCTTSMSTTTTSTTSVSTTTSVEPVHTENPGSGVDNSIFKVTGPCSDEITPQCIRSKSDASRYLSASHERTSDHRAAQYQIPNGTKAATGNELGIFQGLNQHYSQEDLDTYFKYIAPYACLLFPSSWNTLTNSRTVGSPAEHTPSSAPSTAPRVQRTTRPRRAMRPTWTLKWPSL